MWGVLCHLLFNLRLLFNQYTYVLCVVAYNILAVKAALGVLFPHKKIIHLNCKVANN